jgi:hypothetical protein
MSSLRHASIALAATMLIAACQSATGSAISTPPPSGALPSASSAPSQPDAGVTIDPGWVTRPALTCGDPERLFPPEALAGLGLAELGLDPAAGILRATIAETPDSGFPTAGWHRVIDDPNGVTFVAPGDEETPWLTVAVGLLNGTLQATEYGQCNLAVAAPTGVNFGRWWLDPAGPPLMPETTTLSILVREVECASGKPPDGRLLPPTIVTSADAFQIAIGIREQSTAQDCPSNPAYALELLLPEPLGTRGLFDASQFPPRPVTTEDPDASRGESSG